VNWVEEKPTLVHGWEAVVDLKSEMHNINNLDTIYVLKKKR
jgi:hypothetical protein